MSALTAQYIEYFYYGGRGKRENAGRCAFGEENHPSNRRLLHWVKEKSKSLFGAKHAQVADIESSEVDVAEEEEVSESKKLRQQTAIVESRTDLDDESTVGVLNRGDSLAVVAGNDKDVEAEVKEQVAIEYADWICSVCGKENHRPLHPVIEWDLVFGTQGKYYKRPTVTLKPRRDVPECSKCFTYMDYKPPPATRHLFGDPTTQFDVFTDFPKVPRIQSALKTDNWSKRKSRIYSLFFGLTNCESSAILPNDWRLRLYVRSIFPG